MWYPVLFTRKYGEAAVKKHSRIGAPANPVLVSSPATDGRFLPPVLLNPDWILRRIQRNLRLNFYLIVAMTVVATPLFYLGTDAHGALMFVSVFGLVGAFAGFESRLHGKDRDTITERWMFYGWCFSRGPAFAIGYLAVMVSAGALQLVAARNLGSQEALWRAFGLIYADLPDSGQWWRLLTSPLLHVSAAHWLTNTIIGTGLFCIYGPVLGWRGVVAFAVSAPLAFAVVLLVVWQAPIGGDAILGISGGISGLVGCFMVANLRRPASFPQHYIIVTGFVAVTTLFVASYFLSLTSFIAHLAGFLVGVVVGMVIDPFSPHFHRSEPGRGAAV